MAITTKEFINKQKQKAAFDFKEDSYVYIILSETVGLSNNLADITKSNIPEEIMAFEVAPYHAINHSKREGWLEADFPMIEINELAFFYMLNPPSEPSALSAFFESENAANRYWNAIVVNKDLEFENSFDYNTIMLVSTTDEDDFDNATVITTEVLDSTISQDVGEKTFTMIFEF